MKPEVNDLDVYIDSKLNFLKHLEVILSKSRRNLSLLRWIARYFNL